MTTTGMERTVDIYESLGVKKCVNGAGLLTRLGGSLMAPEVRDAMRDAAGAFVDMADLQTRASEVIARHTGAEAGIVTSGGAAAITLATAACLTRLDITRMERLPDTEGMPNEVIMFRAHRTGYDHAIRAAGARIVEVFTAEGADAQAQITLIQARAARYIDSVALYQALGGGWSPGDASFDETHPKPGSARR